MVMSIWSSLVLTWLRYPFTIPASVIWVASWARRCGAPCGTENRAVNPLTTPLTYQNLKNNSTQKTQPSLGMIWTVYFHDLCTETFHGRAVIIFLWDQTILTVSAWPNIPFHRLRYVGSTGYVLRQRLTSPCLEERVVWLGKLDQVW